MVKRAEGLLQGMKEICSYVNRSEATVLKWIRELGFPAKKLTGGSWESDRELIDRWRRKQLEVGDENDETGNASSRRSSPDKKKGVRAA